MVLLKFRYLFISGNTTAFIANKKTNICIEGYPRSSNSYFVRMFKLYNSNQNIVHHSHSLANIKFSFKNKIPIVCLIREPDEAIASYCIYTGTKNIDFAIKSYIHFYKFITKIKNDIVIAKFDIVINNPSRIIGKVNGMYGTKFNLIDNQEFASNKVKSDINKRYEKKTLTEYKNKRIPLPDKERNKQKIFLSNKVREHSLYLIALNLFNNLTSGWEE